MSELLIVRVDDRYLRCLADGFELCSMSRASVFPLSQVDEAKKLCLQVIEAGYVARLMKLTITEEPYGE